MKCPICQCAALPAGRVDFNKTCEDHKSGPVFPSGEVIEIDYVRCQGCGFVWAPTMCAWPEQSFRDKIYNADYIKADPDYHGIRPHANACWLCRMIPAAKSRIKHLDYGGGNGAMSKMLLEAGFQSKSWDPFEGDTAPGGKAHLITAFEVLEHVPNPAAMRRDLMTHMYPDSVLIFSTLTSDHLGSHWHPAEWWYAAPRNGHISLYTKAALRHLFHPLRVLNMNEGVHIAFSTLPSWLEGSLQ